jgi:phytoene dehydrogenase-like protein
LVLEASDGVGGRARTDAVDGFLLDRGFQVLLTAYPQARRLLDFEALDLRTFLPGALVWTQGGFHRIADPLRRPSDLPATLKAPVGSLSDKFRIGRLRASVERGDVEELFARREHATLSALQAWGFSEKMIERFLRPFLSGIFLERDLATSSRFFEFVFRMFSRGDVALPAQGMGALAEQLAARLSDGALCLRSPVRALEEGAAISTQGARIEARAVVVATDGVSAAHLVPGLDEPAFNSTVCLYFAADEPPIDEPLLVLNGEGGGWVNNLCVPSQVAPSYAPPGAALISASIVGDPGVADTALERNVRAHLREWFGAQVDGWRHLRTYRIATALPAQIPPAFEAARRSVRVKPGLYVCGDHRDSASIEGAVTSGVRAAEAILRDLHE